MSHDLHVIVIPTSVRQPVSFVHLADSGLDDLALLRWLYHPEQGWALGFNAGLQVLVNVRATLLALDAGEGMSICGPAVLTSTDPEGLVNASHDLITTLKLDRFTDQ